MGVACCLALKLYFCSMWAICKKEWIQYFSSLTGYLAILLFLGLNGIFLFVFSSFNILDQQYASLASFFSLAPYILMLLIPSITMRLLPDEYRNGTMEILRTKPVSVLEMIAGKYLAAMGVVMIALLPTTTYLYTIVQLSAEGSSIDMGAMLCSYAGLFFLAASFTAISLCCSSFTRNAVAAFLISLFACLLLYAGFSSIAALPVFRNGADYYLAMPGIEAHYRSMARGVVDTRDIIYFVSLIFITLYTTITRVHHQHPQKI